MNNPFGDDLAGQPCEAVHANLDPAIQGALAGFQELAEMFGAGPQATAHAVTANLQRAQGDREIAVVSVLAGMDAIFQGYRSSFASLGASLTTQIEAISAAWDTYGRTGRWIQPAPRKVSGCGAPEVLISTSPPYTLSCGDCINAQATATAIHNAAAIATNLASTTHHMFGGFVANALPVGELMEAIDVVAIGHAKAFAGLHKTLAASIQEFTHVAETSVDAYRQTGQWSARTVTIGT